MSEELSKRLGFAKVLRSGRDIEMKPAAQSFTRKTIATGSNEGLLIKSLKDRNTLGILMEGMPSNKLIAMLSEHSKTLFINVNSVIYADQKQQQKLIYLYRKTMHYCKKFKVDICPISLAVSDEQLLSAKQLMLLAKFLGFDGDAKKALGTLGSFYGKKD
ncbi:MAG: hypothetical protein M1520_00040 [Candidatus Marsarchaeota archaeon]|nr:hypothetical protein [Candidatus Marsarchaeota archaeon]